MYLPQGFREETLDTLHALMRAYNFATLVSQHEGVPFASHVPLTLDPHAGAYGTLYGHVARANPQWQAFASGQEVLVIFQGPHTYVSPSWYETALSVPTWNYAVVHAYGTPRLITDYETCYALLNDLVRQHEASFANPWQFQPPADYAQKMIQGVVCFAVPVTRLEGKYKLNQNRPVVDQQHVAARLQQSTDPLSRDVGLLMHQRQASQHTP